MENILIILTLLFSYSSFAECDKSQLINLNFSALEALSKRLDGVISIDMTNDIPQFCQVNGLRDQRESFGPFDVNTDAGWQNGFIATKDYREASFLMHFAKPNSKEKKKFSEIKKSDVDRLYGVALQTIQSHSDQIEEADKKNWSKMINAKIQGKSKNGDSNVLASEGQINLLQSSFLCTDLTLANALSCAKGVNKIIDIVRPVGLVTLLPLWAKVVEDPNYMKAFKEVSLKITSNLKNGTVPSTRLIDDLQTSFFSLTKNKEKAEDYAWNTMALISAGGGNANMRVDMISDFNATHYGNLKDFLWVISNGSMALDRLSAEKKFLYTFPKEVNNLCDYGKNYHFWMTAYLARELKKDNKNATASAAAAYTVEKGYQFVKKDEGREPIRPFVDYLYSNYTNNMRLDLTLAAAGAWYGVRDNEKELSRDQIEEAMRKTFINSKKNKGNISETELYNTPDPSMLLRIKLYSTWKEILNPDESFKLFQSETGH